MERDFIDKPKRHVNQIVWELDSDLFQQILFKKKS